MRRVLLLFPVMVVAAQAQEMRWGMHAIGSTTSKDLAVLTHDATGFGMGMHAFISDAGSEALRMRLEGQVFPGTDEKGIKTRVYEGAITGDWMHYFSGRTESGPYSVLSMGFAHWRTRIEDSTQVLVAEHKNSFLLSGGLGWQLTRTFGLEAQAWWANHYRETTGKAQGYTAMLTIRF